jgi:hypothetical protein
MPDAHGRRSGPQKQAVWCTEVCENDASQRSSWALFVGICSQSTVEWSNRPTRAWCILFCSQFSHMVCAGERLALIRRDCCRWSPDHLCSARALNRRTKMNAFGHGGQMVCGGFLLERSCYIMINDLRDCVPRYAFAFLADLGR